jgi:hypothetical protein
MEKTGDIFVTNEKKRCVARWRPVEGSPDVFLCAMDWETYNRHPHLRKMFVELATEAMLNHDREAGASMTFRVREPVVETRSRWVL